MQGDQLFLVVRSIEHQVHDLPFVTLFDQREVIVAVL